MVVMVLSQKFPTRKFNSDLGLGLALKTWLALGSGLGLRLEIWLGG